MVKKKDDENSAEDGYFAAYSRFSGTLRAWLVAYGVGGPALVLTQDKLATRLLAAPTARTTILLFLLGVASQVLAAVLYKTAMWYLYRGESNDDLKPTLRYKAASWIADAYFLETGLDLASIGLFGVATYLLIAIFAV